jgi:hypothetical protein
MNKPLGRPGEVLQFVAEFTLSILLVRNLYDVSTNVGVEAVFVVPSPMFPCALRPQQYIDPLSIKAQVASPPPSSINFV